MRHLVRPRAALPATVLVVTMLSGCVFVGGSRSDSNGVGFIFLLVPLLLIVSLFRLMRPSRRRRGRSRAVDRSQSSEPSAAMLRAELSVLSDDVLRLEPQVALKEEARNDYEAAVHRYRVAQAALEQVDEPVDLVRVQRVVDEASWSMSRARAILDGRELPPPPPVLQRPGPHGEPAVAVDEGDNPTYVESPASFQSGWFEGGGLFGGLLFGPMLGGWGTWVVSDDPYSAEAETRDRRRGMDSTDPYRDPDY